MVSPRGLDLTHRPFSPSPSAIDSLPRPIHRPNHGAEKQRHEHDQSISPASLVHCLSCNLECVGWPVEGDRQAGRSDLNGVRDGSTTIVGGFADEKRFHRSGSRLADGRNREQPTPESSIEAVQEHASAGRSKTVKGQPDNPALSCSLVRSELGKGLEAGAPLWAGARRACEVYAARHQTDTGGRGAGLRRIRSIRAA